MRSPDAHPPVHIGLRGRHRRRDAQHSRGQRAHRHSAASLCGQNRGTARAPHRARAVRSRRHPIVAFDRPPARQLRSSTSKRSRYSARRSRSGGRAALQAFTRAIPSRRAATGVSPSVRSRTDRRARALADAGVAPRRDRRAHRFDGFTFEGVRELRAARACPRRAESRRARFLAQSMQWESPDDASSHAALVNDAPYISEGIERCVGSRLARARAAAPARAERPRSRTPATRCTIPNRRCTRCR